MARRDAASQLTERDIAVVRWVGLFGVASLGALAQRFWPAGQLETAMDRLRQLVKAGFLERHVCDVRSSGERVFTLTAEGRALLEPSMREHASVGLPAVAELRQQLVSQDAYLRLEALAHRQGGEMVEWQPERQLRAEILRRRSKLKRQAASAAAASLPPGMEIPDARAVVISAQGRQEILYIEIDGAYYGKMLQQKAKRLARLAGEGHSIIWVCTPARVQQVQAAVAAYPGIAVLCV
jgi:hypothetical protein